MFIPGIMGLRTLKDKTGFTLLEVMIASAILAMFLIPLLGAISGGIYNIEHTRNLQLARQLAITKLEELELTNIPEIPMDREGNFAPEHPDIYWQTKFSKRPELELLEMQIPGLKTMEVALTVYWYEGEEKKELTLTTLLAR